VWQTLFTFFCTSIKCKVMLTESVSAWKHGNGNRKYLHMVFFFMSVPLLTVYWKLFLI